jgi:chemotaxis protein CheZ
MTVAHAKKENEGLAANLEALFLYVQRVRREIASLNQAADGVNKFETMGQQLDGIVEATSDASDIIVEAVERSGAALDRLAETMTDDARTALLDEIADCNNRVLEACAFQDITGQRVARIVKSVTYVETRVNALIEIWGRQELDRIERLPADAQTDDQKLINGPQSKAQAISQDEIDKLFD